MLKKEYTTSHLLTYLGNKRRLLPYIEQEIIKIKSKLGKDLISTFDGFSGSGAVSRLLKYHSHALYVNDLEDYSYIINSCYLSNPTDKEKQKINEMIDELNHLDYNLSGIICNNYAPKDTSDIQKNERAFYTRENALIIDTIRENISNYETKYHPYLLAPLLVSASIHANTSGVFKGFHKKNGIGHFGGKNEVNTHSRITKKIILDKPIFSDQGHCCNVFIYKNDINQLIDQIPPIDVAYFDPPYNQHPYGSNYFMLNTILKNEMEEEKSSVSGIPKKWKRSTYNYQKSALQSMQHLISTIKAKYIIMSYNNEGIISEKEIIQLIHSLNYTYQLQKVDYNTYRGSRNLQNREKKVIEYLWIIQK